MGFLKDLKEIFFPNKPEDDKSWSEIKQEREEEKQRKEEERIDELNNDIKRELDKIEDKIKSCNGWFQIKYKPNCYDYCQHCVMSRIKEDEYYSSSYSNDSNYCFLLAVIHGTEVYQHISDRAERLLDDLIDLIESDSEED